MIDFDVHVHIDDQKLRNKRDNSHDAAQAQLDQDVLKDSNYFIPFDTGHLRDSSLIHTRIGSGKIVWKTKYAKYQYYGVDFNFSHDVNPNASSLWFERAKSLHKKDWLKDMKLKYRRYFNGR